MHLRCVTAAADPDLDQLDRRSRRDGQPHDDRDSPSSCIGNRTSGSDSDSGSSGICCGRRQQCRSL
jgi:hypothetical protein